MAWRVTSVTRQAGVFLLAGKRPNSGELRPASFARTRLLWRRDFPPLSSHAPTLTFVTVRRWGDCRNSRQTNGPTSFAFVKVGANAKFSRPMSGPMGRLERGNQRFGACPILEGVFLDPSPVS